MSGAYTRAPVRRKTSICLQRHGAETPGFIEYGEFLKQLACKDSAP
jgi:hypothetical protein